jgi:hypothetical protein
LIKVSEELAISICKKKHTSRWIDGASYKERKDNQELWARHR